MLTEVIKRKGGFKSAYGCVFREKVLLSRQREFNYTKKVVLYFINMIVMWRGIYRGKVERHTFYENIKNLSTFLELGMHNSCSSKYIMVSDSPSRQNDVLEKPWFG